MIIVIVTTINFSLNRELHEICSHFNRFADARRWVIDQWSNCRTSQSTHNHYLWIKNIKLQLLSKISNWNCSPIAFAYRFVYACECVSLFAWAVRPVNGTIYSFRWTDIYQLYFGDESCKRLTKTIDSVTTKFICFIFFKYYVIQSVYLEFFSSAVSVWLLHIHFTSIK